MRCRVGLRVALAAILLLESGSANWAQAAAKAEDPVPLCDILVASPHFPETPKGQGVLFENIDAPPAIAACQAALDADPENPKLQYQLGRALDAGGRPEEAFNLYEAAYKQGFMFAGAALGYLYESGEGVGKDVTKAVDLYSKAADAGVVLAMENLGYLYEHGEAGIPQDYAKAASLYRRAAGAGSTLATGNLGYFHELGYGVKQDDVEAVRLYRIAAEAGEAFAQNNLGVMYENGRGGLPKDLNEAARLYQLAAAGGWEWGYLNIARFHMDALGGLERDDAIIEKYLRLALDSDDSAIQGNAMNDLAWLYATANVRLVEAEELARKAIAMDPENGVKLDTLAWIFHIRGDDELALPLAAKAAKLAPDDPEIAANLAAIRKAFGR